MAKLEEWVIKFLNSNDSFTTSTQKEEALKVFADFERLEEKDVNLNVEQIRELCRRIDDFIAQTRPGFSQDQILILDTFFAHLLNFIINLASMNTETHNFLRDDTGLMTTLTWYLNHKYQKQDQLKILHVIEVLCKGILVSWSMPYLNQLLKETMSILLNRSTTSEANLYCLRIITNLVFHNQGCLSLVIRDVNYKEVLKRVIRMLSENNSSCELMAMSVNFCYITDQAISLQASTQLANIRNTFEEIQSKIEAKNFRDVNGVASTIYYIALCVSTIINRWNQPEHNERNTQDILDSVKVKISPIKKTVDEVTAIVFSKFFTKLIPLLRADKGQVIVISLLNLMKALCPNNVPAEQYSDLWEGFAKSLNELAMVASPKSQVQVVVLDTHLHFVDRILKSNKYNVLTPEAFKNGLSNSQIVVSSRPTDLKRNILTIRFLNRINALITSQSKNEANDAILNKVSKLLNEKSLLKLLCDLLSESIDDENSVPCIQMSTCIIEILNVISKLSKNPNVLIESLEQDKTWFHISNCIVNGDEELISQALGLMGALGFSSKCRAGVAKTMMEMRTSCSAPPPVVTSPERTQFPSFYAQLGMKKLNDNLEIFEHNHVEGSDQTIDDVLAWYKLKNDMHEMELSNVNDTIFHLNRTIAHLKILLNKQSELVAKKTITTGTIQKNYNDLQKQLEITKENKMKLEIKHAKATQSIRRQLDYQEDLFKTKCARLKLVEIELKESKERCTELTAARDEALHSSRQVSNEKRKLQEKLEEIEKEFKSSRQRLSTLDTDLKKSEEARKTAETLLEAERRKTEIIQQVLGSRLN